MRYFVVATREPQSTLAPCRSAPDMRTGCKDVGDASLLSFLLRITEGNHHPLSYVDKGILKRNTSSPGYNVMPWRLVVTLPVPL